MQVRGGGARSEVWGEAGKEGERDLTGVENHREGHGRGDSSTEPAWAGVSEDGGRLLKLAGWRGGEGHKHCREVASLRRGRGIHLSWGTSKVLSSGLVSAGAAARASPRAPGSARPSGARALPAALSALDLLSCHVAPETRLDLGSSGVGAGIVQRDV